MKLAIKKYLELLIFIALNVLDLCITLIGLQTGNLSEANLLLSFIFEKSLILGSTVKLLLTFIIALFVQAYNKSLFKILNIVFSLIVVWNIIWIILL